ncbi:MAG: AbrB/MazE/SpoVT family DNA-binding domain-containing protein [Chloroflexota bacterium]
MGYATGGAIGRDQAITLGARGRMVLPAPVREQLHLRGGERLLVRVDDDGSIRLISYRAIAEANRGLFADLAPERSLVAELIADRRAEASQEAET